MVYQLIFFSAMKEEYEKVVLLVVFEKVSQG